jgi:O-antigen/teichoic acid export membrane protein
MGRVIKTITNAKINLIYYVCFLFVSFFSRKMFLEYLGVDFIGLTATLNGVLGMLSLAELGIGTAVGYALYKPIYDKDNDEINKIVSLLGYLYKKIGFVILFFGIAISSVIPLIIVDTTFNYCVIFFAFLSFLFSSLLGYFFNYHQVLLFSDQKNYIVTKYYQSVLILKLLVQISLVYLFQNYFIWIIVELLFSIFYSVLLRQRVKKEYPFLSLRAKATSNILKEYPEVIKKVKQIFLQKVSYLVLTGTDNILIYAFANLKAVAFVGNYQLLITSLQTLAGTLFSGTGAAIGNVVAEGNEKNIRKIFWEMMAIRHFIASVLFVAVYFLIDKFIVLWIGVEFILDKDLVVLMLIIMVLGQIRVPVMNYLNAYGLFSDVWASISETILNLVTSLVLGYLWGIKGIFFGTIVSMGLLVLVWKPYFFYKNGFKLPVYDYYRGQALLILPFIIVFPIVRFYFSNKILLIDSYLDWIFMGFKLFIFTVIFFVILFFIFSRGFRSLVDRILIPLRKKIRL